MTEIVILGAGMAGFGASYRLDSEGIEPVMYEKNAYYGGHAASFQHNGFTFDDGPHISFTKNERIKELFAKGVKNKYEIIQARMNNYWKGHWIKHPAQCNLHGLPEELVVDILVDFICAQNSDFGEINNYEDWLKANYGKTFAENFPMQYARKFHTTTADNMSTEWVGPRLYRPELREVLQGALSPKTKDFHYVDEFRYPTLGGFVSYLDLFANLNRPHLNHELVRLLPKKRELHFANGVAVAYDHIISSLPLPELIPMISGVPIDVLEASQKLACTSCILVTIGLDREDISENHWVYFYDHDFLFTRLSFPHMQSLNNAPPGKGMIQAEIYFSDKYHPIDRSPEDCVEPVINDLRRCGVMNRSDKAFFTDSRIIRYANVIFDLERSKALQKVHNYLDEVGINYCGRYGEWGYHWTDQAFISGEMAAQSILGALT